MFTFKWSGDKNEFAGPIRCTGCKLSNCKDCTRGPQKGQPRGHTNISGRPVVITSINVGIRPEGMGGIKS